MRGKVLIGENHPNWKGDGVSYTGLHHWVRRWLEKPNICPSCNVEKFTEVANISGKYKRILSDWTWTCRKCHVIRDGMIEKIKKYRYVPKKRGKEIICHQCGKKKYVMPSDILERNFCSRECLYKWQKWRLTYKNSPKSRLTRYKGDAKKRNIAFNLTEKQFMSFWSKSCFYCGDKIQTIGLDRIKNEIGYEIKNIVSCCADCNYMKSQKTIQQFKEKCIKIIKCLKQVGSELPKEFQDKA